MDMRNVLTNLHDNTSFEITRKTDDTVLSEAIEFFSSMTVKELVGGGNFLVYPNSFTVGNDNQKVLLLNAQNNDNYLCRTSCIAGFVSHKGVQIRIHSRFGSKDNDHFLNYMLRKVCSINLVNCNSSINDESDPLYDYLLFMFPKLLNKAMSKGVIKSYVWKTHNDTAVKGRLDVTRHYKKNTPFQGKVAYINREFSLDNDITELIRATIECIGRNPLGKRILSGGDKILRDNIKTIKDITPSYGKYSVKYLISQNSKNKIHPLYKDFQPLQKLCIDILNHANLKGCHGDGNKKSFGVLFDVAWLWEEYVSRIFGEISDDYSFDHYTRKDKMHLFIDKEEGKEFQQIIPDYLCLKERGNIVADAKYIPLDKFSYLSADRASDIYYKTIMYMYRFNSQKGLLIHPMTESENNINIKTYNIIETAGTIQKLGLQVKHNVSNFDEYSEAMLKMEDDFKLIIKELIN